MLKYFDLLNRTVQSFKLFNNFNHPSNLMKASYITLFATKEHFFVLSEEFIEVLSSLNQ